MAVECLSRLRHPGAIAYDQALAVAVLGLLVNLGSRVDAGAAPRTGMDTITTMPTNTTMTTRAAIRTPISNLRSAYVHVAADAATSVLAIGALAGGKYFNLAWLDAAVGLFASVVVAAWAWSLLRSTGPHPARRGNGCPGGGRDSRGPARLVRACRDPRPARLAGRARATTPASSSVTTEAAGDAGIFPHLLQPCTPSSCTSRSRSIPALSPRS